MFAALRTLSARLTLTFWVLAFILAAAQCFLLVILWTKGTTDLMQQFHNELADNIAIELSPHFENGFKEDALRTAMHAIGKLNPLISILFINSNGEVELAQSTEDASLLHTIDLEPVEYFLTVTQNRRFPIHVENPEFKKRPVIFSASRVKVKDREMYLVVLLRNNKFFSGQTGTEDRYIIIGGIVTSVVLCIIMGAFGSLLFKRITKRFGSMVVQVREIADGDFESQIHEDGQDEVATLAKAINQMSRKIIGSMKETEKADRERREMVAMIVHDLGSPLAAIRGWLELLLSEGDEIDSDKRKDQLHKILRNVQRLSDMIKELFELSKLDANDVEIQAEVFSISELITEDIIPRYKALTESKKVTIEENVEENLFAYANQELIDKVMKNLVENGIRHNANGGKLHIDVSKVDDSLFRVSVKDTGPGIPESELPHIFKRFYRGQGSKSRHSKGGGLGLAIVKRALELQGQQIEVKSSVGVGTTFSFTLPIAVD